MRIEREDGTPLGPTWAVFTPEEAQRLFTALMYYFDEVSAGEDQAGWHQHYGSGDHELTVAIEDEDVP